jgi:hypothetical protein
MATSKPASKAGKIRKEEYKPGDRVKVPVHISKVKDGDKLNLPQQWLTLNGIVIKRLKQGSVVLYGVNVTGNLGYQDEPFEIFATEPQLKHVEVETAEEQEFDIILGSRPHRHNRGLIRCEFPCFAVNDYLVKWVNADATWEPDHLLPPTSINLFDDREAYRQELFQQVKRFLKGVTRSQKSDDINSIITAAKACVLSRDNHRCDRFDFCKRYKDFCRERFDYTLAFGGQELRMLASVAPVEEYLFRQIIDDLKDAALDARIPPPWMSAISEQNKLIPPSTLPTTKQLNCNLCDSPLDPSVSKRVLCEGCKRWVHKEECALKSARNRSLCHKCFSLRCTSCLEYFKEGPMQCVDCKNFFCTRPCVRRCQPTGRSAGMRCYACVQEIGGSAAGQAAAAAGEVAAVAAGGSDDVDMADGSEKSMTETEKAAEAQIAAEFEAQYAAAFQQNND